MTRDDALIKLEGITKVFYTDEVETYARQGDPADAILDVAEEQGADLIIVGNKGMTGAKRFLLCSLCFNEWEFRRLLCPNCGEEDKDKLPVYTAEEFPHIRVEACDTDALGRTSRDDGWLAGTGGFAHRRQGLRGRGAREA